MPRMRDFLDRFRPAGAPGPAGAVGVPADRLSGAETELAPLFAALTAVEQRCAETRGRAEQDAARRTAQARRMAAAIVSRARSQERGERAAAAADALATVDAEVNRISTQARLTAADLREQGARRLPALVDLVVTRTRNFADSAARDRP